MAKAPNIADALAQLDPDNDKHWTSDGQPAVKAVEELLAASTNRDAITKAAPELTRDAAREARASRAAEDQRPASERAPIEGEVTAANGEKPVETAADALAGATDQTNSTGDAPPVEHPDAGTVTEGGHVAQIDPGQPGAGPVDTTGVTVDLEAGERPAVGTGWDQGDRVEPETADGNAAEQEAAQRDRQAASEDPVIQPGARPVVGTSFDEGERVAPEKADGEPQTIDPNPGPHVQPVQADGAVREDIDPAVFQPRAGTAPALQDRPEQLDPTKDEVALASDADVEASEAEFKELDEEYQHLLERREDLNARILEVQTRRDAVIIAREQVSDSHVDATRAYFAAQDAEKAERVALQELSRQALGAAGLAPDVGGSALDIAAASAGRRAHGQARHTPRPLSTAS